MTTVDLADIRGLGTTLLASVGCLPHSRDENTWWPRNAVEGYTKPGLRLFQCTLATFGVMRSSGLDLADLRCERDLLSNGPHKAH